MNTPVTAAAPTALVVGGGLAGLGTAALLARDHWQVVLLERSANLGGRARSTDRDGYAFNLGPHAIYTGGAMSEVLIELGVDYGPRHGPTGIKTLGRGVFGTMPNSVGGLLRAKALTFRDKIQLGGLMSRLPKIDHRLLNQTPISEWIDSLELRPVVKNLLTALAMTGVYSTNLDIVSADVLVEKTQRAIKAPIHYVDGGWSTIVEGLRKSAVAADVTILAESRVTAIRFEQGRVEAVETADGQRHSAEYVVLAVDRQTRARATRRHRRQAAAGQGGVPGRRVDIPTEPECRGGAGSRQASVHVDPVAVRRSCASRSSADHQFHAARRHTARRPCRLTTRSRGTP